MPNLPADAITAAAEAVGNAMITRQSTEAIARAALEAAAPHLAAAERQRAEIELRAAVDAERIRQIELNQQAVWQQAAAAVAAERQRIRQLAQDLHAEYVDSDPCSCGWSRCRGVIKNAHAPFAELLARQPAGADGEPRLVEQRTDPWGGPYTETWACDPPAAGVSYIVRREEWNADYTVRTILEFELVDG